MRGVEREKTVKFFSLRKITISAAKLIAIFRDQLSYREKEGKLLLDWE